MSVAPSSSILGRRWPIYQPFVRMSRACVSRPIHALLMAMSYDDPEVRPLMELEGLKAWRDGRVEGYQPLEAAVDAAAFYDRDGTITEAEYRY